MMTREQLYEDIGETSGAKALVCSRSRRKTGVSESNGMEGTRG